MNKNDLRYIKTDELIINTFLSLAKKQSLEEIRVSDICALARISRNTFYTHYLDKYELIDAIYNDVGDKMLKKLSNNAISDTVNNEIYRSSLWCINAIDEYQDILKILSKCSQNKFREMIRKVFIYGMLINIIENPEEIDKDIICQMALTYITDALTSIIFIWLDDTKKISNEELALFLHEISNQAVKVFYVKLRANKKIKFIK